MNEIRPAADAEPGRWLLRPDVDWSDLVRYGPPGYDVYARIALTKAPEGVDGTSGEVVDAVRAVLATLAAYTTTPASGYAAVWEDWVSDDPPTAPVVAIPHRTMLLFAGPVEALRDAPDLAWYGERADVAQEPHLVWPEDQAWCLACEVDEELEFTVACSAEAFQALVRSLPGVVRRVQYGEPAPMHREPG